MARMGADQTIDWHGAAASALDWWVEAGVDTIVDETPRCWLTTPATSAVAATVADAPAAPTTLPDTLDAFVAWRTGAEAPEAGWGNAPIPAAGDPSADLLVLTDVPERGDTDMVMAGPVGRLFDRMLAAIGRDRGSIYLVPLCAARPVSGRVPADLEDRLADLARHHVALAGPKRLLLLGNAPSRALLGANAAAARGNLHVVNHVRGKTEAVASFHPRFLLEQSARKAEAWRDLQLVTGGPRT